MSLALSCDVVIAAEDMRMHAAYIKVRLSARHVGRGFGCVVGFVVGHPFFPPFPDFALGWPLRLRNGHFLQSPEIRLADCLPGNADDRKRESVGILPPPPVLTT